MCELNTKIAGGFIVNDDDGTPLAFTDRSRSVDEMEMELEILKQRVPEKESG